MLRIEDFDVKAANAKKEKVKEISNYDFIIVGNGMKFTGWISEAKKFLRKFAKELKTKKLRVFVSSAAQVIHNLKGDTDEKEKACTEYLVEEMDKCGLNPIAMTIFGG